MDFWERLLDGSLMPHGYCLLWRSDLLFLHLGGDALTALSYFSIPIALIYLVRKRRDLEFDWIFLMFALFIFFCGITHTIGILNVWYGFYFAEGLAKIFTGAMSFATAIMVSKLMPKALSIPSQELLQEKVHELEEAESKLEKANQELEAKVKERTLQLEQLAKTDDLTGLNNRRATLATLTAEINRAQRYNHPLSVQVIDLDDFKVINDTHGHSAGDAVLTQVATLMKEAVRGSDLIGRIGGEEFLVIMPSTTLAEAEILADRLRHSVNEFRFKFTSRSPPHLQHRYHRGAAQSRKKPLTSAAFFELLTVSIRYFY